MTQDIAPTRPNAKAIDALLDAFGDIAAAENAEQIWHSLTSALAPFGFTRLAYGYAPAGPGWPVMAGAEAVTFTNFPDEARGAEVAGTPLFASALWRRVAMGEGLRSFDELLDPDTAPDLSPLERREIAGARATGLHAGFGLAFPAPSARRRGAMMLAAGPDISQRELDVVWDLHGARLMALCTLAHGRLSSLPVGLAERPLSPRQHEMLDWIADGKTVRDIELLTGLSSSAIDKHLRRAREVLCVETTAHAVAKAAMLNLLFLPGRAANG